MKAFFGRFKLPLLAVLIIAFLCSAFMLDRSTVAEANKDYRIMVLCYHKIDYQHHSLAVSPDDFDWQMSYLKQCGYNTITPDDLYAAIEENAELPPNPLLITFDDGYKDNYTYAYPILQKYGFRATIFVVTGFLGKYDGYLTWDECREMSKNGISIQSHTVNHKSMTDASDEEISKELVDSRQKITEEIGIAPNFMAYPTGTYNLHIASLAKAAGYKGAFTIKYGNVDERTNVYAIERVPIFHTENTNKSFLERIRYAPLFERFGWIKS